jgi:histidyl-tRNA synthetase
MPISEYSFAVIVGKGNSFKFFSLKNLVSGEQVSLDFEGLKKALL